MSGPARHPTCHRRGQERRHGLLHEGAADGRKSAGVRHLHWSIYRHALLLLLAALAVVVGSFWAPQPNGPTGVRIVAAAMAVVGLLMFVAISIRRRTTEIVVTERRLIFKRGILSRHTVEMNVSKIETVDVEQSLTDRLLGYGTLMIHGTVRHRAAATHRPPIGHS
jgi:uncharacterized membrane protein YdbT with pleckstrin-like domain